MTLSRRIFQTGDYLQHFAPESRANPFHRLYAQKRDAVLAILRGPRLRVLDVGGGMGRLAGPLAQWHDVTLCDISRDMLSQARTDWQTRSLSMVQLDALHLPFNDELFDVVVSLDLLIHMTKPRAVLKEMNRVLRREGTLMVDSTNANPFWTLFFPSYAGRDIGRWLGTWLHGGVLPEWAGIVTHYRKRDFLTFLADAGFTTIRVMDFGPRICPKWHLAVASRNPQALRNGQLNED